MDEPLPDIQALQNSDAFQALTQYVEAFDVFRVMGVSNKELVHSTVLANLMRDQATHGLGTRFRDAFISHLCQARCCGTGLPDSVLRATAGATAKISRELAHIDILLDFPQLRLVVAIENKLWAGDQKDQVKRYQQTLRELYPHHQSFALVYLTPTGRDSPTQDPESPVPVYCVSYGEVATLLAHEQQHATVAAARFIEQFIAHIGKTMSGTTELKDRCWELFKQHEEACEHLASNIQYCRFRRLTEVFDELEKRLLGDEMFRRWQSQLRVKRSRPASEQEKHFFDLDLRLAHWPEGVWVKIYKHNWFGVFPFFSEEYLSSAAARSGVFIPARAVPDWAEIYYASTGFEIKEDRRIQIDGSTISEANINIALTKAEHYISEIDKALTLRIQTCGHADKRTEFSYRGTAKTGVIIDFESGPVLIGSTVIEAVLTHFKGKQVPGGFSMTKPTPGGVGLFLKAQQPSLTPRHASFLCAVLVHEGQATSSLQGNAVYIEFH